MRYVDDILLYLKVKIMLKRLLICLTRCIKTSNLLQNFEDKNNISFLDVRVKRESEGFIKDV